MHPEEMIVVLGPGLAPGLASLGVLAELEERNVPIKGVVGVNTGALAAALWAVGSDLALAARVIASLPWPRYAVARDLSTADPLFSALHVLTRGASFHEIARPLTVVALDEERGTSIDIEEGNIAWAVRCSLAVPGLFQPLAKGGRRLLDGGCAWPLLLEKWRDGRNLVVSHRMPPVPSSPRTGGFSPLHVELARLASRSWGQSSSADGSLVVPAEGGDLLDFHLAENWFEAGRRAFRRWLTSPDGSVDG